MYNRYIPQSDGSYSRRSVQTPKQTPPPPSKQEHVSKPPDIPAPQIAPPKNGNALGFLRQLLPKEFDTGDLMIVLLLLLMAGDCEEEKNNALLTLALYFFM